MVSTTEGEAEYLGRGKTDGTVGARIERIRGSFGGQRNPIFIGVRVGITIGACCLNSNSSQSRQILYFKIDCGYLDKPKSRSLISDETQRLT